jgi:sulfur carrier protein ThiS
VTSLHVKIIGFAKKFFGFEEKEIELKGEKRLDEVLDFDEVPLNLIAIIVNDSAATKETMVTNDDKVIITQIVAGGAADNFFIRKK